MWALKTLKARADFKHEDLMCCCWLWDRGAMCMDQGRAFLELKAADSQQRNRDLSPATARDWILLNNLKRVWKWIFPRACRKNAAWLTPWLEPCETLSREFSWLLPCADFWPTETVRQICVGLTFKVCEIENDYKGFIYLFFVQKLEQWRPFLPWSS